MTQVFFILALLAVVVASHIVHKHIRGVPLPVILIVLGVAVAFLPLFRGFFFDPSLFILAVIAPLLYNEAQSASRYWIGRGARNIISLAIVLVGVTVVALGFFINALFPFIPLALAMTLAAIVTPTDAAAVSALVPKSEEYKIPLIILQNESLFNDATGFVAFEISLAAFLTGHFSFQHAAGDFALEFLGGLALGVAIGFVVRAILHLLMEAGDDSAFIMVVIELLVPFVVFFVGEQLEVSGILAVVAAGLVQGVERENLGLASTHMQLVRHNVWEIVDSTLSGLVFVLLGVSLPAVMAQINATEPQLMWLLIVVGVAIYVAKFALRLLWTRYLVWMHKVSPHRWRDSWMMTLSGVSGTMTLSLALMLPVHVNGEVFEYRPILIFIAAVVIVLSILLPVFVLPRVVGSDSVEEKAEKDFEKWRQSMVRAGIKAVRGDSQNPAESCIVIDSLSEQLVTGTLRHRKNERALFAAASQAEITALKWLNMQGGVSDQDLQDYEHFLEYTTATYGNGLWRNFLQRIRFGIHTSRHAEMTEGENMLYVSPLIAEQIYWRRTFDLRGSDMSVPESVGFDAAMRELKKASGGAAVRDVHGLKLYYQERHRRLTLAPPRQNVLYQLFLKAFHAEYDFFQAALDAGKIPQEAASKLQERIIYDELAYLRNHEAFTDRVTPD